MPYPSINRVVGVSRALGAELPYRPVLLVLLVEELYKLVERVAVVAFGVCA